MSSSLTSDDLVRAINLGVDEARVERRVIGVDTARRIAAAVHQGLGSELERFAGTGRIRRHHVARLELHYLTVDEPQMRKWREALLRFITEDQRRQQAKRMVGSKSGPEVSADYSGSKAKGGGHDAPCS